MPSPRSSKRQLEKARQEKAAMKREKRLSKGQGDDVAADGDEPVRGVSQDQVLADLAALHASFADEAISFDDFEERKGELLRLLDLG
jgi:hypothetical protein